MMYLIKSTVCLGLLLVLYQVVLRKEKMHTFNRFYLLGSVLFAFIVPSVTIEFVTEIETIKNELVYLTDEINATNNIIVPINETAKNNTFDIMQFLFMLSMFVSGLFLVKFLFNLKNIISRIISNEKLKIKGAKIVLVNEDIVPHTFLNYIFLNSSDYKNGRIVDEIITHELVHAKQFHSIDILFVELLKVIFWFNPLFYLMKNAMELNHEYQVDEKVISKFDIRQYFEILIKFGTHENYYLTNNINYLATKKRLIMATQQKSKSIILSKKFITILFSIGLTFIFADCKNVTKEKELEETVKVKNNIEDKLKNASQKVAISPIADQFNPKIATSFGKRMHPILKVVQKHNGIDFIADENAEIKTVLKGSIVEAGFKKTYGNYVVVQHNHNTKTLYAHLSKLKVTKGQFVENNQVIGVIGNTGRSTKIHLHFEVIQNDKSINPIDFLNSSFVELLSWTQSFDSEYSKSSS